MDPHPAPPSPDARWTVVFANVRSGSGNDDYLATVARMEELARGMDGFLGVESVRSPDGTGITVSY